MFFQLAVFTAISQLYRSRIDHTAISQVYRSRIDHTAISQVYRSRIDHTAISQLYRSRIDHTAISQVYRSRIDHTAISQLYRSRIDQLQELWELWVKLWLTIHWHLPFVSLEHVLPKFVTWLILHILNTLAALQCKTTVHAARNKVLWHWLSIRLGCHEQSFFHENMCCQEFLTWLVTFFFNTLVPLQWKATVTVARN